MRYEAILFDLDGTLLPMDYDEFTRGYFGLLYKHIAPLGYTKEAFISGMWKGVAEMTANDGTCINSERFWEAFSSVMGKQVYGHIPQFDEFYHTDFKKTVAFTGENPLAKTAVLLAREKADTVILATSPIFPMIATEVRMGFVGLTPEDFDLVTHYENSTTCKPNPAYYTQVCEKMELDPKKCLMIGNNGQEDIEAAQAVGMDTYLVTDWLINEGEMPKCKTGTFAEMVEFLRGL